MLRWAIAMLALSTSPAATQGLDPERMSAFVKLRGETEDCYRQHTARLDDNLSDARTIGEVISSACELYELAEIRGVVKATEAEARVFRQARRDRYLANAVTVVLEQRTARAKARR